MNLQGPGDAGPGQLLYANFHRAATTPAEAAERSPEESWPPAAKWSLVTGRTSGYSILSLPSVERLEVFHECRELEDVGIVEPLFAGLAGAVALVSLKAPRKLSIRHLPRGLECCSFHFSTSVLAVRASAQRLLVCLEQCLFLYGLRDLRLLHVIKETPPNPAGVCALSPGGSALAYVGSASFGNVQVFDTALLRASGTILAHDSPLAALAFDRSGTQLATASEKGTVIRVFSVPWGQKLHEFRRGLKRCVTIHSLAFSGDGAFLAASSNTETVHVFKLPTEAEARREEEATTWLGYFGKALLASTLYLPSQVTEVFHQDRAFATAHLPCGGHRNICSVATIQKMPRLLVASSDGHLYIYNLDPQEGGECTLVKRHQLYGQGGDDQ
ncbi:WD repeat domain phosphoinositide-interacting protein 2-like [Sorex araneus]|uniref:WD repeat domain phosphoinositide-interacting protein 2-like n=1 Tax=Sorex araneus TaxID=42254 RepID=UPI0024336F7A|nr:WD repeat domain phosphoinositide-interacting protein 2-like [Sorex araneus]